MTLLPDTKIKCSKCEHFYSTTKFIKDLRYKRGFGSYCSFCRTESQKKNPQKAHKRAMKNRLKRHGLSEIEYQLLLEQSNGKCTICNKKSKLVIDHCHKTNRVRGLLCQNCNALLGMAEDNIETLINAISYLKD